MPNNHSNIYVLYHAHYADGFGAAWATHKRLGDHHEGSKVHYLPVSYGEPPPEMEPGSQVYIFDFSFPRETMMQLRRDHQEQVTIVDHHETAQADLEGIVPDCHFDISHSGAHLAWTWWFPGETPPLLIDYIEDRDLWKWQLPQSREVSAALGAHPKEFHIWDKLEVAELANEGAAILRNDRLQVQKITQFSYQQRIMDHMVPVVNTPVLMSEACEALLENNPQADFAGAYFDRREQSRTIRKWSLRSNTGFDVSQVAKALGGGGHVHAAGFTQTIPDGAPAPHRVQAPPNMESFRRQLRSHFDPTYTEDRLTETAINIIQETLLGPNGKEALSWITELCSDTTTPSLAEDILKCLRHINLPGDDQWRKQLVYNSLQNDEAGIRESAVQLVDHWEEPILMELLRHHHDSTPWIRDYINQVLEDSKDSE